MDFCDFLRPNRDKREIVSLISKMPSNYVGSKRRMLLHIWDMLDENNVKFETVFDAFSGSAMVSLLFKMMGKKVICNDLLTSSSITALCLLENDSLPLTPEELNFLSTNVPSEYGSFVKDNYSGKFFTEKECDFLDRYKANVAQLFGDKFYCGLELLGKATLASIPNSNFSVYGKDLKSLRSTHEVGKSFWKEKWRDTTRKRRDENNEIKFPESLQEMYMKYKGAFSLFAVENHVNQNCFLGGRYYNGQTVAKMEHRISHPKNNGKEITDIPISVEKIKEILRDGDAVVFNSDIMELLESGMIKTDLIYLDPPYGGASSDYAVLYRFLEEYLYEDKLENLEHIQKGSKRFSKSKGYQEQFEELLSLCQGFDTWLISYNESSYADLETIKETIRKAGRKNIVVKSIPITYQYRKNKNAVDVEHFKENYYEEGYKFTERGTEYLILARV
ncbi:MAG: DNA adenine methylase [Synergistaceae bacterium]